MRQWLSRPLLPSIEVICVGNVIAGGAGKTPIAIAIARHEQAKGKTVAFLSKNYGGTKAGPAFITATDRFPCIGDEALLLAQTAPTIIARNRRKGLIFAQSQGVDCVIMDDGYQNPTIRPGKRVLVLDGYEETSNGFLLPAGPLRQPVAEAKAQADIIIKNAAIEICDPKPDPSLTYTAFCGIAQPEKFFDSLQKNGYSIAHRYPFPDHHAYKGGELDAMQGTHFITTQKDWVRLNDTWKNRAYVLQIRAVLPQDYQ